MMTTAVPTIEIDEFEAIGGYRFAVSIRDVAGMSRHDVTMSAETFAALRGNGCQPGDVIDAAFRFLLDRESKDSILTRFDVNVIGRYFPDFERALPGYLAKKPAISRHPR